MKKKLIPHSDSWLYDLAFAYCMGRSFLFRMFFGWRESNQKGCVFILPKRIWHELESFGPYYTD